MPYRMHYADDAFSPGYSEHESMNSIREAYEGFVMDNKGRFVPENPDDTLPDGRFAALKFPALAINNDPVEDE